MSRMIRKQIYIESRQDNSLKKQARDLGVTEAEVIRRAIDRQMTSVRLGIRDRKAWEREKAFISKRTAKGRVLGGRQWKRDDAYEERLMRYGR
jgi:hypothetical protein